MALTVNTNIINDTDQYLLDAKNVKGGYVVVNSTTERDALPAATRVAGSLCYCTADSKFYQYNGTIWAEKEFITIDTELSPTSSNPVQNKVITSALDDYTNQNAFSNVAVDQTTIAAASTTDTLTFVAGDNITITPNTQNGAIEISADAYTKDETDRKIDDKLNTFVSAYITSDGGAIDKMQEIANWIDSDKNGAADIIADVEANSNAIATAKTLDKISVIDNNWGKIDNIYKDNDGSIIWHNPFAFTDDDDNSLQVGYGLYRVPIVAGENITFDVDETNNVVKINAADSVPSYSIDINRDASVVSMITMLQNMGADISKFNIVVVNIINLATLNLGLQINHYGGTVYNIRSIDLTSGATVQNTTDWSGVTMGVFTTHFESPLDKPNVSLNGMTVIDAINEINAKLSTESMVGTWVFNDVLTLPSSEIDAYFLFKTTCDGIIYEFDNFYVSEYSPSFYSEYGYLLEDIYSVEFGWYAGFSKTIEILEEPTDEAASWIKANAKRYEPIGVDKVALISTYSGNIGYLRDDGDGIVWSRSCVFKDGEGNTLSSSVISQKTPIAQGANVTFTVEGNVVKINAASGLPSCDDTNEGQFLRVVGGVPTWSTVPNAEDNAF